jgi:hypothetical protein
MKKKYFFIICLFFAFQSGFAQENLEKKYTKYGQLLRLALKNAPFPSADRTDGYTYQKENFSAEKHYQDSSVFVFIPQNFKSKKATDFVVYFHGWYNNIDSVLTQFLLIEQFSQAKINAILVIPQMPKNSPDSNGGKLEKEGVFLNFIDEVVRELVRSKIIKNNKLGDIVLAGHSGAYRVIAYILMRSGLYIPEVYLFDGLYGELEKFAVWLMQAKGKFINFYTNSGDGTEKVSNSLMEDMQAWKMEFMAIKERDCTIGTLANNRILMIYSPLKHDDVVHLSNNFYKCLVASDVLD